jgi:hypothetical protein
MEYVFDVTVATPLCSIMGKHGSDKGDKNITTSWHNYTTFYYSIFKELTQSNLRVFELGLGTNNVFIKSNMGAGGRPGASLYGWKEFFPNAKVYGADIDKGILFDAENIRTYYCDQTNPDIIKAMWDNPELKDAFDIIIEDGLHEFSAKVCFFEHSIHKLSHNGYYIIEDILNREVSLFEQKINEWKAIYPNLTFTMLRIPSTENTFDNNLLVVRKSTREITPAKKVGILIGNGWNLFTNGMIQNAYFLLQCLEKLGHPSQFLCYDENPAPFQHKGLTLKTISAKPTLFNPADYKAVITVTEGLDRDIHESLKKHKVATIALVCGCTMMMDQEYFYNINAPGAYIGKGAKVDELWVIPSYKYMLDYVEIIRGAPAFIMPHLWSPECIQEMMRVKYKKPEEILFYNIEKRKSKKINIIILEPNFYIVKNAWIPLVAAEKLHKEYPDLIEQVYIFNYPENEHAERMIASLSVASKIRKFKRLAIPEILDHFNNNSECYPIFLSTQLYNSLNYLYYEILYYGYPLIHNSPELDGCGYYYPEYDLKKCVDCVLTAHKHHDKDVDILKDKAKQYLERVNPLNADVGRIVNGMIASAVVNANK